MGGHAFRHLPCPRMSPEVYVKTREQTMNVLRSLFARVAVPAEIPGKLDYGDVDFLVSSFLLEPPGAPLNWQRMVARTKHAFDTPHGRKGHLNPDVIYLAIPHPDDEHWIQIDIKVYAAQDEETFAWMQFQLLYASGLKMLGSLIKPLGLTISPTGLHIRVEEMEGSNFPGSLVLTTKEPADVLRILGLDRRFLCKGFGTTEELYQYFASTWVFNPAHYAARLEEGKYRDHLDHRSAPWVAFVTEWLPQRYPGYSTPDQDIPLDEWRHQTRVAMREKVFTLFPHITPEYYTKRAAHLREVEEHRLQQLLMVAIPAGHDGWSDDISQPTVFIQEAGPATPTLKPTVPAPGDTAYTSYTDIHTPTAPEESISLHPPTPPHTPPPYVTTIGIATPATDDPLSTPLHLEPLPRKPPLAFIARPPPTSMSTAAKLGCLARWTLFDPTTGTPYLARSPRDKTFSMCWSDSGARDEVLVAWAREMWWRVWARQARVNYLGLWRKRFEKEDANAVNERVRGEKAEKVGAGVEKVKMQVQARRAKIFERLAAMNGC